MLVLRRKHNERIVMTGGIIVTVLDIKKDGVSLGIDAPQSITIHREEVAIRLQELEHNNDV